MRLIIFIETYRNDSSFFSRKWNWDELPLVPRKTWNCVIKIGMKKGKKYFVTDTTIFFTQKLHTSVYINDHALYSFTFHSFYIYSVVAFFIFWLKCNKQIIFVMKYGVILYQTDKHCVPPFIIYKKKQLLIFIFCFKQIKVVEAKNCFCIRFTSFPGVLI